MDESESPILFQWLSACRFFMAHHPLEAAAAVNSLLTDEQPYRLGWNHVKFESGRELFIHIAPDKGLTTSRRPENVPPDQIYEVAPVVLDFEQSVLWRLFSRLSAQVNGLNLEEFPAARIDEITEHILAASRSPTRGHDVTLLKKVATEALNTMKRVMSEAATTGQLNNRDLLYTALNVVRAYMRYEIAGREARELLAVILSSLCNLPNLTPLETTPPQLRKELIEHLADLTYQCLKLRSGKKLTPYCELTYLAGLYAGATMVLVSHAEESRKHSSSEVHNLAAIGLNVDEQFAHEIMPLFRRGVLVPRYETARIAKDEPAEAVEFDPIKRSILNTYTDPENWKKYAAQFQDRESFDVIASLESELDPISPSVKKNAMLVLLTFGMGRLR